MKRRTKIQGRPVASAKKKFHAKPVKAKPKLAEEVEPSGPITTGEIRNLIADTIERLYNEEFDQPLDRANAEEFASYVSGYLRHGITDSGLERPPRLTEVELRVPLCEGCKGE
jgi:hypothetical protein